MIKFVYIPVTLVIVSNMVDQGRIILHNFGLLNLSVRYEDWDKILYYYSSPWGVYVCMRGPDKIIL